MYMQLSELDSARFGLPIGRWTVAADEPLPSGFIEAFVTSPLEVLVLRFSADRYEIPAQLAAQTGDTAQVMHADTLLHAGAPVRARSERSHDYPADDGYVVGGPVRAAELEASVRDIFAEYTNHYASNPRTPAALVVDGYVEWALAHLDTDTAAVHTLCAPDGEVAAVAAVSYRGATVEVNLAGVGYDHRRRRLYQRLLDEVEDAAAARGATTVTISTQAHNLPPQRAWAQRGWLPLRAVQTLHVVRQPAVL
jgi:GNAT superfamily N-acetyltransferase